MRLREVRHIKETNNNLCNTWGRRYKKRKMVGYSFTYSKDGLVPSGLYSVDSYFI